MLRAIFALILTAIIAASIVSSSTVSAFADWATLLTLVFSLGIGIPTLFVMKSLRYGEWWQSMLGGLAIPVLVGIPIPMFIGLALAGGVIVWIIGIFRNPAFTSPKQKFPISILLTPFAAILIWMYSQAVIPPFLIEILSRELSLRQQLSRRYAANGCVRPLVIVLPKPLRCQ